MIDLLCTHKYRTRLARAVQLARVQVGKGKKKVENGHENNIHMKEKQKSSKEGKTTLRNKEKSVPLVIIMDV